MPPITLAGYDTKLYDREYFGRAVNGADVRLHQPELRLNHLRRKSGDFQSDFRRRNRIHPNRRRRRHARTHAAVRSLPPNYLGILRRCAGNNGELKRRNGNLADEGTFSASV